VIIAQESFHEKRLGMLVKDAWLHLYLTTNGSGSWGGGGYRPGGGERVTPRKFG